MTLQFFLARLLIPHFTSEDAQAQWRIGQKIYTCYSRLFSPIASWWLSDLLKRQNNRFKPTSDSCDSPAVSKSDTQPSNFVCKLRPKPLLNNCAHLLPTMCALMLIGRFGSNQLAMVWTIKRHFSIARFLCFPTHPRRPLSGLKASLICAPFDQI